MTWLVWGAVLAVAATSFIFGFAVARFGSWARLAQIESRMRSIKMGARVMQDMGDTIPAEWVADQIEWALAADMR